MYRPHDRWGSMIGLMLDQPHYRWALMIGLMLDRPHDRKGLMIGLVMYCFDRLILWSRLSLIWLADDLDWTWFDWLMILIKHDFIDWWSWLNIVLGKNLIDLLMWCWFVFPNMIRRTLMCSSLESISRRHGGWCISWPRKIWILSPIVGWHPW